MSGSAFFYETENVRMHTGATDSSFVFNETNIALLQDEDAGWRASSALFSDFMQSWLKLQSPDQIMTLLGEFEQLCFDQTQVLGTLANQMAPGESKFTRTNELLSQLTEELHCWRLVRTLFEDRLEKQPVEMIDGMIDLSSARDDRVCWDLILKTDKSLRELELIRVWCERNAADQLDDAAVLKFFGNKTFLWENSLHNLKAGKSGKTVREIDPDAPLRGQSLDDEDAQFEAAILQLIFAYVRSGKLEKAVDVCVHCGQAWRAATLLGGKLHSDPNRDADGTGAKLSKPTGNANRSLWKRMCWMLAEQKELSQAERAIYGALSGRLSAILPLTSTWQDRLWAFACASVEHRLHVHLAELAKTRGIDYNTLPQSTDDQADFQLEDIFLEIETFLADAPPDAYREIEKQLMLDDAPSAVDFMHKWLSDLSDDDELGPPRHLVRFMAHLVLVYRILAIDIPDALANGVLELYVRQLSEDEKCINLVAFYAAQLPRQLQIRCYSVLMLTITNKADRRECLRLADSAQMDVPELCRSTVENARNKYLSKDYGTTDSDMDVLVAALEWLLFDPELRIDALLQCNAVIRMFLDQNQVKFASKALSAVGDDAVNIIQVVWERQNPNVSMPDDYENIIKEHLCYRAYLDALESFNCWNEHLYGAKPNAPEKRNAADLSFTEQAEQEMQAANFERELQKWNQTLEMHQKAAVQLLYNVLLFPEGGWLIDTRPIADEDDQRREELRALRSASLPKVAVLLLEVLRQGKMYREALVLADTIAGEERQLYKAFDSPQLKQFVLSVTECAARATDDGLDCVACVPSR